MFDGDYATTDFFLTFLRNVKCKGIKRLIKESSVYFLPSLILSITDFDTFDRLFARLNKKYRINLEIFISEINTEKIVNHISELLQDKFDESIEKLLEDITSEKMAYKLIRTFMNIRDKLREYGFYVDVDYTSFNDYDWDNISFRNYRNY